MDTDNQLLERYARDGSEAAFRELVERRINLVYSAALRESKGDASLAEDITQAVFSELARHAPKLVRHPALAGWLYTCVRRKTANAWRTEDRRKRREQEAFLMNELVGSDPADQLWQEVRPVLDDVMHELKEEDRTVVVLRFFEGRNLKEIGSALGLSENAARMRVERSLEKLRSLLARRGVKSTASTLASVVASGAVLSAPSALASTVATSALATVSAGGSATFALAKMLSLTKTQVIATGVLVVLVGVFLVGNKLRSNRAGTESANQPQSAATDASATADSEAQVTLATAGSLPTNTATPPQMPLRVVDAETGEPLAGAKLHLSYFYQDGRGERVKRTTDANGAAGVDMVQRPFYGLNMFVTADAHVPKVTSWGFGRAMPESYTMRMERGITIGGVVVDEAGLAIPGAKIEIDDPGNDRSLAENIQFGPDTVSHTDFDGRWSCNMIPKTFDRVSLVITHPDYAEGTAIIRPGAADAGNSTISMQAGFTVAGLVEDSAGNPIEGAKVREVRLNGERERSRRSDAAGIFELNSMRAGELMLSVQAEGFAPAVQTLQVTCTVARVRFRLGPGHLFRGHVIDEDGNPVPNVWVETTRRDIDKVEWSTRTDFGGRFAWTSAPQEAILYSFQADGFNRAYALKLQADGSDHEIRLTRERATDNIQITGMALDAETGKPLGTFRVLLQSQIESEGVFPFHFAATGQDGKFSLSFSARSSHPAYQIMIESEGYVPAVSAALSRKAGNQTLQFRLQKGSGPSGVVLLPDGAPAVNATVLLCTPQGGVTLDGPAHIEKGLNTTTYRALTDGAGRFSLPAVISPQGLIVIHDQGYAEISSAPPEAVGQITLQPWGRVEGTVILDSQPVANERVIAFNRVSRYDEDGRHFGFKSFSFEARTDSAGKFTSDKVAPGQYNVLRQTLQFPTGFESHETSVVVQSGAVTHVTLGGGGRAIIGKASFAGATSAIDWRKVSVRFRLKTLREPGARPKRADFSSRDEFVEAVDSFYEAYRAQRRFGALCNSDGSFRVPDMPAGTYQLEIQLRDTKANSVSHDRVSSPRQMASLTKEIFVPEISDGQSGSLDLGILELIPQQESASTR